MQILVKSLGQLRQQFITVPQPKAMYSRTLEQTEKECSESVGSRSQNQSRPEDQDLQRAETGQLWLWGAGTDYC